MKVTVDVAREYFRDTSQQIDGITPDTLPAQGCEYWALGPVCGVFHPAPWPRVWMAHYAVKEKDWGKLDEPARMLLQRFWKAHEPERIIGWTRESNRLALAFARRIGFEIDGAMNLPSGRVIMQGWRP